mmetsp:Transcript_8621/g.12171  ORF Transcript_8621/g.12171 Transcript_8621/m.12171 type:complete len:380 (+) Transcript_8621:3-1142(+)
MSVMTQNQICATVKRDSVQMATSSHSAPALHETMNNAGDKVSGMAQLNFSLDSAAKSRPAVVGAASWALKPHVRTLGVGMDSSLAVVCDAFRRKALQAHPDKEGSVQKFKAVLRAFHGALDVIAQPELAAKSIRSMAQSAPRHARGTVALRLGRCSIERVVRAGNKPHYRVAEQLDAMQITMRTQYTQSLEVAIEMCMILTRCSAALLSNVEAFPTNCSVLLHSTLDAEAVGPPTKKRKASSCPADLCSDIDRSFHNALQEACVGTNACTQDFKMSFASRAYCTAVKQTVEVRRTASLAEALQQRNDMLLLTREDWPALRARLITMRQMPTSKRLATLTDDKAAAQIDKLYMKAKVGIGDPSVSGKNPCRGFTEDIAIY